MAKKNTTKRLMDVQKDDKLYIINKMEPYNGITEVTVTQTGDDEHSVESWFIYDDHVSRTYIPRSSMKKSSMSTYDLYIGTSRAEVLKAAAKLLVKSMERTTKAIGNLSDRLVALRDTQAKLTKLMEEYGRSF